MNHDDLAELLGAYALHALDPAERAALDAHLAGCPKCRAELRELEVAATALGNTGGDAPAEVWDRITQELDRPAPPLRLRVAKPAHTARQTAVLMLAAAAVGLAAIGGLATAMLHQAHRIDHLQVALAHAETNHDAAAALALPGARPVALTSETGSTHASAVVLPDGEAFLVAASLPGLPKDQTYQLWGQTSDGLISLGVLGDHPGTERFHVSRGVTALAVTAERAPGVQRSSNSPVVAGSLS